MNLTGLVLVCFTSIVLMSIYCWSCIKIKRMDCWIEEKVMEHNIKIANLESDDYTYN